MVIFSDAFWQRFNVYVSRICKATCRAKYWERWDQNRGDNATTTLMRTARQGDGATRSKKGEKATDKEAKKSAWKVGDRKNKGATKRKRGRQEAEGGEKE